jgi:hypothetical protein
MTKLHLVDTHKVKPFAGRTWLWLIILCLTGIILTASLSLQKRANDFKALECNTAQKLYSEKLKQLYTLQYETAKWQKHPEDRIPEVLDYGHKNEVRVEITGLPKNNP